MSRNLDHMAVVASATVGSRVLGLLRDMALFAGLGAGAVSSAFLLAFTLPNLFRRLLGEGALTSALIPVLADAVEKGEQADGHRLLNQVLTRLFVGLSCITTAGMGVLWMLQFVSGVSERFAMAADLAILLLPYMIMVCLAAIMAAALNVMGRFGIAALSQIWLNLAMIAALGAGAFWFSESAENRVLILCFGVLIGGSIQVIVPALALRRDGWRPTVIGAKDQRLTRVIDLLIPGLVGAAVIQINIMASRLIAYWLSDDAVSILYLANRLVELPLGVFVIAVTTVSFPAIARCAARDDHDGFALEYAQATRLILAITLPAAAGLMILARPILQTLFEWGAFSAGDVETTIGPLWVYALGLPFYALATLATRGLHAQRDMRTPVRIAITNLTLNIILSLVLMVPLGIVGLALANVVASCVQWLMLARALKRRSGGRAILGSMTTLIKIIGSVLAMTAIASGGSWLMAHALPFSEKGIAALQILVLIPLAILVYASALWWSRFDDRHALLQMGRRLVRR